MKKLAAIQFTKGFNSDAQASELAPEVASFFTNAIIRDGFAARVDGIDAMAFGALVVQPQWMQYYASEVPTYDYYMLYSDHVQVHAWDGAVSTNITRLTDGVAISNMTAAGTTVTVTTAVAHLRTTADLIDVFGALEANYNVTGKAITVTGANTFTYVADFAPVASPATNFGQYTYNVQTNFTSTSSAVGGRATGGDFQGIALFNHPLNGLYEWNGVISRRLRKVPNAYLARVSRPFLNFIFQLSPTIDGVEYTNKIQWSTSAEPGSLPTTFVPSSTNNARGLVLGGIGDLIDALPFGDSLIVYGQYGRYSLQYVGGNEVFRATKLRGNDGLLYRHCVVDTPLGHVFLTNSFDVMLFDGQSVKSLNAARCRGISAEATTTPDGLTFLTVNAKHNEVWVCQGLGRTLIWNWKDDAWGTKFPGGSIVLKCATTGLINPAQFYGEALLVGAVGPAPVYNAFGFVTPERYEDFSQPFTSTVEKIGMDLGDRSRFKTLQRSRIGFDAAAGQTLSVYHGSAPTADATPTYASAATYTIGTSDFCNARATAGRYLAIKISWVPTGALGAREGRFRTVELEYTEGGTR